MSSRLVLFSVSVLSLSGCHAEPKEWVLGECIVASDAYESCDEYCDDAFETRALDEEIWDDRVEDNMCEFIASSIPLPASGAIYSSVGACEARSDGFTTFFYDADIRPLPTTDSALAARCCCLAP